MQRLPQVSFGGFNPAPPASAPMAEANFPDFPVIITGTNIDGSYQFQEVWYTVAGWVQKTGGRYADSNTEAFPLPGLTFDIGDYAKARWAEGNPPNYELTGAIDSGGG